MIISRVLFSICGVFAATAGWCAAVDAPVLPRIAGEWWTIAGDPDLGALSNSKQQPVDFSVWQAADGTWQLWSCIRGTKAPGNTRLLYRWETFHLEDRNWTEKGIAMQAEPALGERPGGLQAPFVFRDRAKFWMVYGDWEHICLASSDDGKTFTRVRNDDGKPQLFSEGSADANPRDPMVIRIGENWFCYYTAHPDKHGADYVRTSGDLFHWSESRVVARAGQAGGGPYSAECPFVVEAQPGHFFLFRTQKYGENAQTSVYHSRDPFDFGNENDAAHFVTTLPVAAPEILQVERKWFIAALLPNLKGIQVAPLEWTSLSR